MQLHPPGLKFGAGEQKRAFVSNNAKQTETNTNKAKTARAARDKEEGQHLNQGGKPRHVPILDFGPPPGLKFRRPGKSWAARVCVCSPA